mgnify:CR=1 FL=1
MQPLIFGFLPHYQGGLVRVTYTTPIGDCSMLPAVEPGSSSALAVCDFKSVTRDPFSTGISKVAFIEDQIQEEAITLKVSTTPVVINIPL